MPKSEVKGLDEEPFNLNKFVIDRYNEAEKEIHFVYGNCLIFSVKLKNGYVIVEHCICRDSKKYDAEKGIELCKHKIINKLLEIYDVVTIESPENIKKFPMKVR